MSPRVLVLILASDNEQYYRDFQESWRFCMTRVPSVDYYFYKANPNLTEEAHLEGDVITVRCVESLHTVWEKFVMTLTFLKDRLDKYDFILRPNLSSFYIFDRYLALANRWPRSRFCSAVVGYHDNIRYPSGSGFTITPDIALRIADEKPSTVFLDDVTLGAALQKWDIPITPVGRYDSPTYDTIPSAQLHIRIKSSNRVNDVRAHLMLAHQIYGATSNPL